MSLGQFLTILRARWLALLGTVALVVGVTVIVSLFLPKRYSATTQVIVDVKTPDPILGFVLPAQLMPSYLATQIDIITSQKVALRVVDKLGLSENQQAQQQWREATEGRGSIRHYYADLLLKHLEAIPARDSSVVSISYSSTDPRFAATVANEFARAYVDTNIELRVEPARQSATWFDEQSRQLRASLDAAQNRLTEYQRTKGIVSADERMDVETAKLQELSSQLTQLTAIAVESAKRQAIARQAMTQGGAGELPSVIANPLVAQLKADQIRLEGKLKEQGAILGANHPEILKIKQEIENNRLRLGQEIDLVAGSLTKTAAVDSQREVEVRAALDRQRNKVLQIKQVRDELTVLQRDVENAQRAYDGITQRLTQTSLESQAAQANILILTSAEPPLEPSSPKIFLYSVIAIVVGGVLGLLIALLREMMDRRVRSLDDLQYAIDAPVIALIHEVPARTRILNRWHKPAAA